MANKPFSGYFGVKPFRPFYITSLRRIAEGYDAVFGNFSILDFLISRKATFRKTLQLFINPSFRVTVKEKKLCHGSHHSIAPMSLNTRPAVEGESAIYPLHRGEDTYAQFQCAKECAVPADSGSPLRSGAALWKWRAK